MSGMPSTPDLSARYGRFTPDSGQARVWTLTLRLTLGAIAVACLLNASASLADNKAVGEGIKA